MPKAFILVQLSLPDAEAYRASGYMAMAEASVAAAGGRFLVRGGDPQALEGGTPPDRTVILEFPSRDAALQWHGSAGYGPAKALRQRLSSGTAILLDEYAPG